MQFAATQLLGADLLAGCRLDQRRAGEKDRTLITHDHRFVTHRRDIGAAGGAATHHAGDLRDALGAHLRLIEEDPAEMVAIGEHLGLVRQVRPAAVDQIDAGQVVGLGNFLGAKVLLHGQRVIGPAFDRRIVGHDHARPPGNLPDPGDDPGPRNVLAIDFGGGELADFEQRRAGIEQPLNPFARQQLAAAGVAGAAFLVAAQRGLGHPFAQFLRQRPVVRSAGPGNRIIGIERSGQDRSAHQLSFLRIR